MAVLQGLARDVAALSVLVLAACASQAPPLPRGVDQHPAPPSDFQFSELTESAAPPADSAPVSVEPPALPPPMMKLPEPEVETVASLVASDARYRAVQELLDKKQYAKTKRALDPLVATEDGSGRYDRFLAGKALSAWLAAQSGDLKAARDLDASVIDAWKDSTKAVERISKEAGAAGVDERNRRLGLALNAVGQSTFARAEADRSAVVKLTFPSFRGVKTKEAVLRFVNTEVPPWLTKKNEAIRKAEKSYEALMEIQPFPPPRWATASAERVASMWSEFADSFASAPVPKEWESMPEIAATYHDAMVQAAAPLRERAQAAYRACVGFSDRFRMEDTHSLLCRKNLTPPP